MTKSNRLKILIIDDSKLFANVIKSTVSANYEIVGMAISGQEGIEMFKLKSPDIVLLDVTMPNMDGRECLEKILSINPKTIVVMVSAIQKDDLKQECLKLGAEMFINKDQINISDDKTDNFLTRSLEAIIEKRKARKAG